MTTREASLAREPGALQRVLAAKIALRWELVAYAAILGLAIALRFADLGTRALHHDESIHAQWSWSLLQGSYHHSPVFHGPFYYHVQALVFLIFGANDYTSRVSAAIFGTAIVALPLLLRRRLGQAGTLAAVAFIALSPTLVYYSRFFREDIYMAFFTMLMVVAIWRYIDDGRSRWLYVLAAAFTGNVLTKEGAFLAIAVFLVYVDLHLANELALRTLRARSSRAFNRYLAELMTERGVDVADAEMEAEARAATNMDVWWRRVALTLAIAPIAWAIAALWPFLGSVKRSYDWSEELPRPGDLLILLGTFTLPLLTPVSRFYILEPFGIVEKDRLSWELHLQGSIAARDQIAILGLFSVTTSIAAFAGLQWKPKLWTIAFLSSGIVYLTLMTSFWTNLDGLISGPWGSLDYWHTQQHVSRGDQPWFYYYMLMPAYEFLPLALCIGGAWWTVVRGNAFSRFLAFWFVGMFAALSLGAEKMPWLNTHLALPACVLAAYSVQQAWSAWKDRPSASKLVPMLGSVAMVSAGGLAIIAFLPGGNTYLALRLVILAAVVGAIWFATAPSGRKALGMVTVTAVIGALAFFSVRTMVMASFERGDDPRDLLIYTQSSGQLASVSREINALAAASGRGYDLRIAVDSTDSFAWPWAWYLRDYRGVNYSEFSNGVPAGEWDVILVNQSNLGRVQDYLANSPIQYGPQEQYPHRWWFDETYKYAMAVAPATICSGLQGDCGPRRLATWEHIWDGVVHKGWATTWLEYWRDHDPGRANGSTDAFAFFPANFDRETGKLSARPLEPPKPGEDADGHRTFGGAGSQGGQFFSPVDIESDRDGNLYVIDSGTKRLQKFDKDGNFLASADIRIDRTNSNEQSQPWGLAVAPSGEVVVADTFGWRIRVFDKDLNSITSFGDAPDTSKTPGPFDLFGPRDVAVDSEGHVWVTDTGNDRIQVFTLTGEFVKTVGSSGNGEGQFDEPVGIDIGKDGAIYVADMYNSRVEVLNADGSYRSQFKVDGWGGQEVNDKPYLRVLADGRVAVSLPSRNEVRVYNPASDEFALVVAGSEPIDRPYGIVETADAKLWIVEGGSARVREFPIP
ncbi:MAG: flippase activity-associated protein Agl23 [Tepidiformaceae bacterium]